MNENIIIINCGSQFTQLIARRLREMKVHSVILNWDVSCDSVKAYSPKGIIISGGPDSVNDPDAIMIDREILNLGCPVLGICYGMQLLAKISGGIVSSGHVHEYGVTMIHKTGTSELLNDSIPESMNALMSHGDNVSELPEGFVITSSTDSNITSSIENMSKKFYGLQFHPEVVHTEHGNEIIRNFVFGICKCSGDWNLEDWVEGTVTQIKKSVGNGRVVCGLSGGVDSSVSAALVNRAIGDKLQCVFVNHGLMRLHEPESVMNSYKDMGLNVIYVDASDRFLRELSGVT
ncbi:MAG: glutamine-hydrolyzing GMP synthase, partial [Synergistaceae bacterium]|nr:glutamine-hydrolyzing GMP synthase [Synergistaceae bacterium]